MTKSNKTRKPAIGAVYALTCALLSSLTIAAQPQAAQPPAAQTPAAHPLPEGKGKAEFIHNCTACHRAEMVTRHPKTPEEWRKSVDDMAARGTDGTPEDLNNVVLYLTTNYSKDPATPPPSISQQTRLKQILAESAN